MRCFSGNRGFNPLHIHHIKLRFCIDAQPRAVGKDKQQIGFVNVYYYLVRRVVVVIVPPSVFLKRQSANLFSSAQLFPYVDSAIFLEYVTQRSPKDFCSE